ncbi:MAG: lysozyme inhibitor LprI family protein [Pseudomonadota bacterium]
MIRKLSLSIAAACLVSIVPARAEEVPKGSEVDKAYQVCLDAAIYPDASFACIETASEAWDKILNANYKTAMDGLDPENQALLRDAQRKWLAYRDADARFRAGNWTLDQGRDLQVILSDTGLQILRARAQALEAYRPL